MKMAGQKANTLNTREELNELVKRRAEIAVSWVNRHGNMKLLFVNIFLGFIGDKKSIPFVSVTVHYE